MSSIYVMLRLQVPTLVYIVPSKITSESAFNAGSVNDAAVTAVPTIAKIGTPIPATHVVSKSITVVLTMPPVLIL